ncbi:hypothetical protein B566_EDAN004160 [Ephemera danica]|nr:hypothetical protein B566_EDAN004160 [Ephemera danica]
MYSQFYFVLFVLLLHAYNVIDAKPPTKIESVDESSAMRLMKKISGDISPRIIGGSTASEFQFPWIAFIKMDSKYMCGGTLISPRHVLIPASQAEGTSTFEILIFNGDFKNANGENANFKSKTKIIHPDFNPKTFANDIAIIELPSAVNITEKIQPIRLPAQSQTNKDFAGMEAIVAGWGIVTEDATC